MRPTIFKISLKWMMLLACLLVSQSITASKAALPPQVTVLTPVTEGFNTPLRIAADTSGNYYVSDPRGGGVLKYDNLWNLKQTIPTPQRPLGIAVMSNGNILVGQGDHVTIFNAGGVEIARLGSGAGQFKHANGIALDDQENIYVSDSLDNCILIFNSSGTYVSRFGSKGTDPEQISSPAGIAFEKSSRELAVADTLNGRIQFYDLSGTYKKSIGSLGAGPLKFTSPQAVAFEYDSTSSLVRMYVVDSFQSNVQMINPSGAGTYIGILGSYGTSAGQLVNPSDVLLQRSSDKLIVVNSLAGNVSVFGINSTTGGPSLPLLSITNPPTTVSGTSITLTGTISTGAIITATTDSGAIPGIASYPSSTTWSLPVDNLNPGINHITVTAASTTGEYVSQTVAVCVVTASTTIITINPVTALTNVSMQIISGTMQANDSVSISTNTTAVAGAVSYPSTTTWEVTINSLAPGDNVITAAATNGSAVSAASTTITLDATPPVINLAILPEGSSAAVPVQNVFGTATDQNLDRVTVNDVPATMTGNYFSSAVILSGGSNSVKVQAYDKAGNVATVTRNIVFQTTKSPFTIASPSDVLRTRAGVINLQGTVENAYSITVNGQPATQNGSNWNASVPLVSGVSTMNVAAADQAGNSTSMKRTIINGTGPELAIISPAEDTSTKVNVMAFSGTTDPGSTVTRTVNGTTAPVSVTSGAFNFNVPFSAEGTYTVTVTATNDSGSSSIVRTIFFDTTPPDLTVDLMKAWNQKIVGGTAESGSIITVENEESTLGTAVALNGIWGFDLSAQSFARDTLSIQATDAAGNVRSRRSLYPTGALISGNGEPDIRDVLKLFRIALGYDKPTQQELLLGDIAPMADGKPQPNGIIDSNDVVLLICRLVGLVNW